MHFVEMQHLYRWEKEQEKSDMDFTSFRNMALQHFVANGSFGLFQSHLTWLCCWIEGV